MEVKLPSNYFENPRMSGAFRLLYLNRERDIRPNIIMLLVPVDSHSHLDTSDIEA